jgi:hypothetical protein
VNSALQKLASEVIPAEIIKPTYNVPLELTEESNMAPPIFIAASGKSKPTNESALEKYNKSKSSTEPPDGVIIEGHSKKALTEMEDANFRGTFRAMARFNPPEDEIDDEKIYRLRKDGWKWEDVVKQVHPDTADEDIPSEVNRVKQRYHRYCNRPLTS